MKSARIGEEFLETCFVGRGGRGERAVETPAARPWPVAPVQRGPSSLCLLGMGPGHLAPPQAAWVMPAWRPTPVF